MLKRIVDSTIILDTAVCGVAESCSISWQMFLLFNPHHLMRAVDQGKHKWLNHLVVECIPPPRPNSPLHTLVHKILKMPAFSSRSMYYPLRNLRCPLLPPSFTEMCLVVSVSCWETNKPSNKQMGEKPEEGTEESSIRKRFVNRMNKANRRVREFQSESSHRPERR